MSNKKNHHNNRKVSIRYSLLLATDSNSHKLTMSINGKKCPMCNSNHNQLSTNGKPKEVKISI